MNRRCYYILYLILSFGMMTLSSCRKVIIDTPEKEAFLDSSGIGFYQEGIHAFTYSGYLHQMCVNTNRLQFRIQTDIQDTCMNVILDSKPRNEGDIISASVCYEGAEVRITDLFQFECSRIHDDKVWLWDSDTGTGVVIPDVF